MLNRTSAYLFTFALLQLGACASNNDDGIWMPPGSAGGKTDGYTTIQGSDIPSAYVDPNKSYIIQRNIANLNTVGALDAVEGPLAKRIDGIIANMPADGELNLAELVRMENPTINASLFPQEKAALPKLWKLVEAPSTNDTLYGPKDNFGSVDDSLPPAAAVPPSSLLITSLSAELQDPATRLQNLYNSDGNTATVTLSDLAMGVANPAAFTPTEVTAFGTIQGVFRTQAVATSQSNIVLSPGPGIVNVSATLGPAQFQFAGTTTLAENRSIYYTTLTATLTSTNTLVSTVTLPANTQLLVINQDSGAETIIPAGTVPSLSHGTYVYEAWTSGARVFSTNADLPTTALTQTINLGDKLDYTFMAGLNPLVRNLTAATATYSGGYYSYTATYSYDKTAMTPPANVNQAGVTATATPTVTIPVGRYSFPNNNSKLYVYSNNVMWFTYGGTNYRLLPQGNNGSAMTRFVAPNGFSLYYDVPSSTISCSSCQPSFGQKLDASMRDI